jgi:hypothetical protein
MRWTTVALFAAIPALLTQTPIGSQILANGGAPLPTAFSGTTCANCIMSSPTFTGGATLDGRAIMTSADMAGEVAARNAAIAAAAPAMKAVGLADATLSQTATVAVSNGYRTITVAEADCQGSDRVYLTPIAPLPSGYSLTDAWCGTTGQLTAQIYGPALALGASYSIPVRVTVFR